MREVHDFGPLYCWGGRYDEDMRGTIQRGTVRNIEPPYRTGRGIEIQLGPFVVGFGFMNLFMRKTDDEDLGLTRVGVMGETPIESTGEEIGEWDGAAFEADDESDLRHPGGEVAHYRETLDAHAVRNFRGRYR